jgi:cytochrome oxidase Cu insertion factor (SCO1/SenC/PrrC family)
MGALLGMLVLTGCAGGQVAATEAPSPEPAPVSTEAVVPSSGQPAAVVDWVNVPLTDAVTGEKFTLADYKGKPVLLHAFAVW